MFCLQYQDDPMFEEFLELHAPEQSKKLRELLKKQQESEDEETDDEDEGEDSIQKNKLADEPISDLAYMKKLIKPKEKLKKEPKQIKLYTIKVIFFYY